MQLQHILRSCALSFLLTPWENKDIISCLKIFSLKTKNLINKKKLISNKGGRFMSAEKEIVNYWYNKKGLFTVNNIKTSGNRDAGILALKFDKNAVNDIFHIQVSCSITNNISETANLEKSTAKIVGEKFEDKAISGAISSSIRQFSIQKDSIKKIMVIGAMPKRSEERRVG